MRRKIPYFDPVPGAPAPISVTVKRRIRFSEVDALGIAWHGRYPVFFEEAQTELGHKTGLTYEAYRQAGIAAPIAQLHTDYFIPLYLDDIISITAALHWSDGARLNTEYRIENSDGRLACSGYTVQLFVDLQTREPLFCPPALWERCRESWRKGAFDA